MMSETIDVDGFLAHHGVKGMRWGHTTGGADSGGGSSRASSGQSSSSSKPTSRDIKDARKRTESREDDLSKKELTYYTATSTKGREAALNTFKKAENAYLNHPDTALAGKLTRGEKIVNGFSWAAVGTLAVAGIGLSIASKR